jgi:hypothetical protein
MKYFCNLGGSLANTLHVDSIKLLDADNLEASTPADVKRIISETGATLVSFARADMPQRAVAVNDSKLDKHLRKLFAPAQLMCAVQPVVVADYSDLDGIIVN